MIIKPPPKLTNRSSVISYIEIDLWSWMKQLATGILKLDFQQNFQSFIVRDLVIPAGVEVAIPNEFLDVYPGLVPSYRMIVRQSGNANIIDGDTLWNTKLVYLKNPSANEAIVTVIFFR